MSNVIFSYIKLSELSNMLPEDAVNVYLIEKYTLVQQHAGMSYCLVDKFDIAFPGPNYRIKSVDYYAPEGVKLAAASYEIVPEKLNAGLNIPKVLTVYYAM